MVVQGVEDSLTAKRGDSLAAGGSPPPVTRVRGSIAVRLEALLRPVRSISFTLGLQRRIVPFSRVGRRDSRGARIRLISS